MNASASFNANPASQQEDLSAIYDFATKLVSQQIGGKALNPQQFEELSTLTEQHFDAAAKIVGKEIEKATRSMPPAESQTTQLSRPDLPKLPAPTGPLSLDALMTALSAGNRRACAKAGIESLEAKGQQQQKVNEEQLTKMKENMEKLKEKSALEGWLSVLKVIAIVVAAVAAVASVASAVCTCGATLPVIAAVVSVILAGDTISGMATDGKVCLAAGITTACVACGMDHDTAGKVALGVEIAICLATIALGVGAARAGAKAAAITASKVAVEVAAEQAAKEAAKLVAEEVAKAAAKAAAEAAAKAAAEEAAKAVAEAAAKQLAAETAKAATKEVAAKAAEEAVAATAKATAKTAATKAAKIAVEEAATQAARGVAENVSKNVSSQVAEEIAKDISKSVANTIKEGGTKVAGEATEAATKMAAEQAAKQSAKMAAEQAVKEAAKEAAEAVIKAATKEGLESFAGEATKKAIRAAAETAATEAAESMTRQAIEQATKAGIEKATEAAAANASMFERVAAITQTVTSGVGALGTIGQGAFGIQLASKDKEIADIRVSQKELEAILEGLKSASENEQNMIRAQLELDSDLMDRVSQIVKKNNETQVAILTNSPSIA